MMKKIIVFLLAVVAFNFVSQAQSDRWQQRISYMMNIDVDVATNKLYGTQKITYSNNSPETLNKLFMHLYWNAFQPNSSMDVRSRELGKQIINNRQDWDGRVKDRILNLKEDEIGYQKIKSVKLNGVEQPFKYHETILEVVLAKPILPKSTVVLDVVFEAQVPLQIRRAGRDNPNTGVQYSMSQWYPKVCEFDYEGWHPTPYVAREFYGVWGDFDVTIKIDKRYKLGGTGVLVNANEIGWGYDKPDTELKNCVTTKRSWHFVGKNVHDFVWAADTAYKHYAKKLSGRELTLHVIFKPKEGDAAQQDEWAKVLPAAEKLLPFIEKNFGKYPYPQYSFIHGGDGGMEYAMATLLQGPGIGTVIHEWMHSWYQQMLGTNESMHAWMDEGFTSYAETVVNTYNDGEPSSASYYAALKKNPENKRLKELIGQIPVDHVDAYLSYYQLVKSDLEEPLTTHADHYNSNFAYSVASYSKGEVFLEQLGYIIGAEARNKTLLEYYKQWAFKHPNPNDFIRVAEKVSGIQLDWYNEYWCKTTKTINYSIDSLWEDSGVTKIRLRRIGQMPMPVDLELTFKDGSSEMHNIPLNLMFGNKSAENATQSYAVHSEWLWTHPTYIVEVNRKLADIKKVEIDPSKRMADIDRNNNLLELKW